MQENNFEKQVQQKMEELSFTPSAPVWQKVELQIRKDKDRRRLILWIFPLLLLGGGLVWYMAKPLQNNPTAQTEQNNTPKVTAPEKAEIEKSTATTNENEEVGVIKKAKEENTFSTAIKTNKKENITTYNSVNINKKVKEENASLIIGSTQLPKQKKTAIIANNEEIKKDKPNKEVAVIDNPKSGTGETEIKRSTDVTTAVEEKLEEKLPADTITVVPPVTASETTAATVAKEGKGDAKWHWDVKAGIGMANQVSGILNNIGGAQAERDVFASPVNNTTGGLNSPGAAFVNPSQPVKGLSYSVGAAVKRSAGKRSFVTLGLQYSYYSTSITVGSYVVDSSVAFNNNVIRQSNYYRNNNSRSDYTNRYHYIEMPVGFQYQLFKNIPLQLHHGISVGYLVSSNAVYYDNRVNIYYNDKDMIRKGSVNLFTGADYRLWKGAKFSIFAGPQVQYGLRTVYKDAANNGGHLFSAAFNTRISF